MSAFVLFVVGSVVFALTVYGAVMAGGLSLTKKTIEDNPQFRRRVDDEEIEDKTLPTDAKF